MGRPKKSIPGVVNVDNARSLNWAFELYEESCNPDWEKELEATHIPAFAIWHNKDLSAKEDGSQKKPHCHVMLMYGAVKSEKQVLRDVEALKPANEKVVQIKDRRGYGRYLCHLDNLEKHQYDPSEVMCFSGTSYLNFINSDDLKTLSRKQSQSISRVIEIFRPATQLDLENLLQAFSPDLYDYATRYNTTGVSGRIKRLEKRRDPSHIGAEYEVYNYYFNAEGLLYEALTGVVMPSPFDDHGELIKGFAFPLLEDPFITPDIVNRACVELYNEKEVSDSDKQVIMRFWRSSAGQKYLFRYAKDERWGSEQVSSEYPPDWDEDLPF